METRDVVLIKGEGIGPEVTSVAVDLVDAVTTRFEKKINWIPVAAGEETIGSHRQDPLPKATLDAIEKYRVALKGPLATPFGGGIKSLNVRLRQHFDLFACVRPNKYIHGIPTNFVCPELIDITIIRENTEGDYVGIEFPVANADTDELFALIERLTGTKIKPDSAAGIDICSESASDRIIRYAFDYAVEHGKTLVTGTGKPNIKKHTDGLFLRIAEGIALRFAPEVKYNCVLSDDLNQKIPMCPSDFQVIVARNSDGDKISDLVAGLVGGVGFAPSANIGTNIAIFEATHGTWPLGAGQNKANPTAIILSAKMMLEYFGWVQEAAILQDAVESVYRKHKTIDIAKGGPYIGTKEFGVLAKEYMGQRC